MSDPAVKGARARTRRAILDSAVSVLCRRPGASLADVAEHAEVGRTTLHRYFPERSALIDAVALDALEKVAGAVARAHPGEGTGRAGLLRVCRELHDLGDVLTLVFSYPDLTSRSEWQDCTGVEGSILGLVEHGHTDGSVDPALTPVWARDLLWSVLYAADSHVREQGGSRHEALGMALRSLDGALRPHPDPLDGLG